MMIKEDKGSIYGPGALDPEVIAEYGKSIPDAFDKAIEIISEKN